MRVCMFLKYTVYNMSSPHVRFRGTVQLRLEAWIHKQISPIGCFCWRFGVKARQRASKKRGSWMLFDCEFLR